jgi:hypothetical protein
MTVNSTFTVGIKFFILKNGDLLMKEQTTETNQSCIGNNIKKAYMSPGFGLERTGARWLTAVLHHTRDFSHVPPCIRKPPACLAATLHLESDPNAAAHRRAS